jgi:hypothetical protein
MVVYSPGMNCLDFRMSSSLASHLVVPITDLTVIAQRHDSPQKRERGEITVRPPPPPTQVARTLLLFAQQHGNALELSTGPPVVVHAEVQLGLGRIIALYYCSSTSYQIH